MLLHLMENQFTSDCRALMRHEIITANGNEIFFIGRTNVDGIVYEAETIARGSKVAVPAIITRASSGDIVIHNHPSGDPSPSPEDLRVTRQLVEASRILGIRVLDHIVIGEEGFTSLAERKKL